MTTATSHTFASLIARYAGTLSRYADRPNLDGVSPAEFVQLLDDMGGVFTGSASLGEDGELMTTAATYLRDALPLADGDPTKQTLLAQADKHLNRINPF